MLDNDGNKKKFEFKPTKNLFFGLIALILVGLFIWSAILAVENAKPERATEVASAAGAGAGKAKNTSFDGTNQNEGDQLAIQAYCDDVVNAAKKGEGAKIKDLCVLNEITRKYIPMLSDAELADLATNNPSCLDTGYDNDGFNCFTNFDKNGCSKSGLDEDGNECVNVRPVKKDAVNDMLAMGNGNFCDLVSGCNTKEDNFDENGFNIYGCNRQGRRADNTMCPSEYITKLYDENDMDQLGFFRSGFNSFGCDIQGLKKDGSICPISEVTRVIGKNGKDIYGFKSDGYNDFDCDIKGLNRLGEVCPTSHITRILDPNTNLDQFGFGPDGFNENNCDINGFTRTGEICALEDMTLIYGSDGFNQLKLRASGFNSKNCNLEGHHPDGSVCDIKDIPRLFSKLDGKDQFGHFSNGRNVAGCDLNGMKKDGSLCSTLEFKRILDKKTKLDRLGLSVDGFNSNNCNLAGFDRNGSRCDIKNITRVVDEKTGLDQLGLDDSGFNSKNCNLAGFDRNGARCNIDDVTKIYDPITGLDQFGVSEDGYNEKNCDVNGLNRNGEICNLSDITRIYNPATGLDQFGLSKDGYNENDCNLEGFNRSGVRCSFEDIPKIYNENNVDQLGFGKKGLNSSLCDFYGKKEDGSICTQDEKNELYDASGLNIENKDKDGFGILKFDELGFNSKNCDINGHKPDGTLCAIDDITRVYDPITKLDQFGLTKDGLNEWGCGLDGKRLDGSTCKEEHTPFIYDAFQKDQFGNSITDKNIDTFVAENKKTDDLKALLGKNGEPVFIDGEQVYVDEDGVLRFSDGRAARDENGEALLFDKATGKVKSISGKVFNGLKDKNGESVRSGLSIPSKNQSPMLDKDGNQVFHNGKPVFIDEKDGRLRYSDGTPVYDKSGNQLFIGDDGTLIDENGKPSDVRLTSRLGQLSEGAFKSDYKGKLTPLVGEDGELAFVDGKQVFLDDNGVLRFKDGTKVLDSKGNTLRQVNGALISSAGDEFDELTTELGSSLDGPYLKLQGVDRKAILDEDGEQMYIDGKPVFADEFGVIVDENGNPVLVNGKKIALGADGIVRDETGTVFTDYTNANGEELVGAIRVDSIEDLSPVIGPDGSQMYIDGKPVFADKNGNMFFADGKRAVDENGSPLSLVGGKAVNSMGKEFELKDINGKTPSSVYRKDSKKNKLRNAVLNERGEAMFVDGKQVFADENGVLRFADGSLALDENGSKLKIGADGVVRNDKGEPTRSLRNKAGVLSSGKMTTESLNDLEAVVSANGESMFVDGKQVFADKDGVLRFADGSLALDGNGSKLTLGKDGIVRNELDLPTDAITNRNGKKWQGKVGTVDIDSMEPLFDENGESMFVDGKQVFADKNGVLRFADGSLALDENGSKLTLGKDGVVRDKNGKKSNAIKTQTGAPSLGSITKADLTKLDALLNDKGETMFVDGKQVFADEDGVLRFADGSLALDENGSILTLGKDGVVRDLQGNVSQSLKNRSGEVYSGKISSINPSSLKVITDENGEDMYIDGKQVFADENGVLRFSDGSLVLDKNGSKLKLGKDGVVRDDSGEKTNQLTNEAGVPSEGKISTVESERLKAVFDKDGQAMFVDGKQVFADENGVLRFANGKLALDSNGSKLTLGADGVVRNEQGIKTLSLKNSDGEVSLSEMVAMKLPKLKALLNESGESMFVDGKQVFVDENGVLRFSDGSIALDDNGSKLVLNKDGVVIDESGVPSKSVKNRKGEISVGGMSAFDANELEEIFDSTGEKLFVDGKQVFSDKNGVLRFADGSLALDKNGSKLTLGKDGVIRDNLGQPTQDVLTQKGGIIAGNVNTLDLTSLDAALSSDGSALFVDGKQVFVDENGVLRFADGTLALDENGSLLKLGKDGIIRNNDGFATRSVKNERGVVVNSGIIKQNLNELEALLDGNGSAMFIDGKQVFADEDGVLRFSDGSLALDDKGHKLLLGDDGVVRDEFGVRTEVLETENGSKPSGLIEIDKKGLTPVLGSDGEPVFINGEQVFSDGQGNLYYKDGTLVKNEKNEPLKLGSDGKITSPDGEVYTDIRNESGQIVSGELTSKAMNKLKTLVNENGEQAYLNGKPLFIDKDGVVRYSDGSLALDSEGNPLVVNEQGELIDSRGNKVSLTNKDGSDLKGRLIPGADVDSSSELPALLNSKGEQLTYNGKPVFVDKLGNLRTADGSLVLGKNGLPLSLNSDGVVVDSNGSVIPASEFRNLLGEVAKGSFVIAKPISKHALAAKNLAEKLSYEDRIKLGLGDDGYNINNCDLAGLDRNGFVCALEDIPRLFDKATGLDQFQLGEDNYNLYGCDLSGLNRQGEACPDEYVTVIRDKDGFSPKGIDENGLTKANLTVAGVNALGCDLNGVNCSEEDSPKLTDSVGVNQFNKKSNGRNRIGFIGDFNENNCDINGLNAKGEICEISDITRLLSIDGVDQFGINNETGLNAFGCGLDGLKADGSVCKFNEIPRIISKKGYDQHSLDSFGRNEFNCDLSGFNEKGELCELSEIPRIFDVNAVDQLGFRADGFNEFNCDINGFDRSGQLCSPEKFTKIYNPFSGLDQQGFRADGFNEFDCDINGLDRNQELCAYDKITKFYDDNDLDQFGFSLDGFNKSNCNYYGYDRSGKLCSVDKLTHVFSKDGEGSKDQFGVFADSSRNEFGCDINGFLINGERCKPSQQVRFKNSKGVDKFGLINDFNLNGCDINGLKEDGTLCDIEDVTKIVNPETGRDQFELDSKGMNIHGCGVDGLDENGKPCDLKDITRMFDATGLDQFRMGKNDRNNFGCDIFGYKSDGTRCSLEETPVIMGDDGFSQIGYNILLRDKEGYDFDGYDIDNCDSNNIDRDGKLCPRYRNLQLTVADGNYIDSKKAQMIAWMGANIPPVGKDITSGTYVHEEVVASIPATPISGAPAEFNYTNERTGSNQDVGRSDDTVATIEDGSDINIPAGYMTSVYVKTPVNSDYTNTVYADISMGELEGAVLVGTPVIPYIDDAVMPRDKFYYEFNKMIYNRMTIPIDAITIELGNDSGMVEADDVDYHRFQRYGGVVLSAAIQALDATFLDSQAEKDAALQAEEISELANTSLIYGNNMRELTKENLKTVTQHVSDLAQEQFNRRPTITKGYGPQVVIFRSQIKDARLPMVFVGIE